MSDEVTLTYWESRICTFTGKQRFANANDLDRDPGQGPPHDNDRMDIRGAHCEFAASIMLNLYWRPTIGETKNRDVGGLVEVRSTVIGNGRLIVKPRDDDDAPFALVVADMATLRFRFGGWMFGHEAKAWPLNPRHGDPAHYVEQEKLWPRSDLMFVLDGKR
jgi:hypothetical protein